MKRKYLLLTAIAAVCALTCGVEAQMALRVGGGMIFDGSQPGGHASLILPFSDKPAGLMIATDYYKKDNITTVPVSARGLYNVNVGEKADVYLGLGSGLIYTKREIPGSTASASSTKMLFSGVGGLKINMNEKLGLFGEVSLERALTSGADSNLAGKVGIAFTLSE